MMVNTRDVKKGNELLLEIASVEAGAKRTAASWKDDAKSQKKAAVPQAQTSPKAIGDGDSKQNNQRPPASSEI